MTSKKFLAAAGFILILLGLGLTDAMLTAQTLWLPGINDAGGIAKKSGPDVLAVLRAQGFAVADTTERQLLQSVITPETILASRVLLQKNDRIATLAWVESPDVKELFTELRKRLRASFSADLRDLIDETQTQTGKPPRDVLSFSDPAVSSDRLVFTRVRNRLYEFHVTAGKEKEVNGVLDALTE